MQVYASVCCYSYIQNGHNYEGYIEGKMIITHSTMGVCG